MLLHFNLYFFPIKYLKKPIVRETEFRGKEKSHICVSAIPVQPKPASTLALNLFH